MRKVLAAMCSAALVACSGSGSGGDGTTATTKDFVTAQHNLTCALYVCFLGLSPSESSGAGCPVTAADDKALQDALDKKLLNFDAAKAAKCVSAVKTLGNGAACWGANETGTKALQDAMNACNAAATGAVAIGGSCYDSSECANGRCDMSNNACPGKCVALAASGGDCSQDSDCASGLSCVGQKCAAPLAKGQACDASDPNAAPCADGLYCNAQNKCDDTKVALGADCVDNVQCPANSGCLFNDPNSDTGKCTALGAAGADCEVPGFLAITAGDCLGQQVCFGLTADDQGNLSQKGKCATPSDVNQPCDPGASATGAGTDGCYLGLICDPNTKKCLVPPTAGQACINGACAEGLLCDGSNKCVAAPAAGSPCVSGSCASGAYCDDKGTCQALKGEGQDCASSDECQGECDDTTKKCGPAPAADQTCKP